MRRNNLMQLLAENRRAYTPMAQRIQRDAADGPVTLYLYDPIVGDRWMAEWTGGVCPQDFVPALRAIDAEQIDLRINCPGGDVFAAEAMCQAIREHKANITAHIEGLAASAATAITCACDQVLASPASQFMVHETWTFAIGNKGELRRTADLLDKCDQVMLAEYQRRSGNSLEQLTAWVEGETWFTAEEAMKAGFVDEVKVVAAGAQASARRWNLSAYTKAPKIDLPDEPAAEPPLAHASDEQRNQQQRRLRVARVLQPIE
jgi:ATP-dependent protease ClpP protease subunit